MAGLHLENLQVSSPECNGSRNSETSNADMVSERSMPPRRFSSLQVHKHHGYFDKTLPGAEVSETTTNVEQSFANGGQRRSHAPSQAQQHGSVGFSIPSKNRSRSNTFPIMSEIATLARRLSFWPHYHSPSTDNTPFGNTDDGDDSYTPLHTGPHVTISSGDGTEFWDVDPESSTFRNAAAQCLYRSLQRRSAKCNGQILDGHMEMIFGAVEQDVNVMDVGAWRKVVNVSKDEDWRSVVGMVQMEKRGFKGLRLRVREWFRRRCGTGRK